MMKKIDEKTKMRIQKLTPHLNESQRRMFLALETDALGRGGIIAVSAISGVYSSLLQIPAKSDIMKPAIAPPIKHCQN